jgi:hypothetical protein
VTPLDRAAKTLFEQLPEHLPQFRQAVTIPFSWTGEENREGYRQIVRAVLTAIREPSEVMKGAAAVDGGFHGYYDDSPESRQSAAEVWQSMIDAALAEA